MDWIVKDDCNTRNMFYGSNQNLTNIFKAFTKDQLLLLGAK